MKKPMIWDPQMFKEHFETSIQNNSILSSSEKRKFEFYLKELQLKNTDVVLDAGCGYGRLSKLIRDNVKQIIGIDINPDNIAYAKEYAGDKFEGHVVDLSSGILPFQDTSIDNIIIDNVLTFLNENEQKVLFREFKRVLKKGGVVVFNFENSNYFLKPLSIFFISLYKLKAKLQGKITPTHFKFSLSFYEKILCELGFTGINSIGDTFYYKMGVGMIEMFPRFIYPYIIKSDSAYFNTPKKKRMYSITVAASLS